MPQKHIFLKDDGSEEELVKIDHRCGCYEKNV